MLCRDISVKGEVLKGHLDLILLGALKAKPAYGYALIRELGLKTNGALELTEGTLYPVLHRLESAGYLESETITVQSRQRRLYRITSEGEKHLETLVADWAQFSRGIENLLRQSGS
jgi:DNA-binding PadR family transcriptional regulator